MSNSNDDVITEAAPATENHRQPLLVREEPRTQQLGQQQTGHDVPHTHTPTATQQGGTVMGTVVPNEPLPDAPDVLRMWKDQKTMMRVWISTSLLGMLFFGKLFVVWVFYPSLVACISAITASCMYLGVCKVALATQVRSTIVLGTIASVMDTWNAILTFMVVLSVDCSDLNIENCHAFTAIFTIFGLYLVWHAWLSAHLAGKAKDTGRMMNPVSSGMVPVMV